MSDSDNGWNLVRLKEDQMAISDSRLIVDLVSEGSHVDDDILSNTSSSEELADFSFRSAAESTTGVRNVSDSLDTLTYSKTVERSSKEASWSFRTWQVVVLTSLISVSLSLGVQKFWNLSVADDWKADLALKVGAEPGTMGVTYSDFDFLTATTTTTTTAAANGVNAVSTVWKPSGKFYVDFDNRIAYPMSEEDMIGWKRCKADSMILWYTAKSKALALFNSKTVRSLENAYHEILVLVTEEAAKVRNKLSNAERAVVLPTMEIWQATSGRVFEFARICRCRTLRFTHFCRRRSLAVAEICRKRVIDICGACEEHAMEFADIFRNLFAKLHWKSHLPRHMFNISHRWHRTLKGLRHYNGRLHGRACLWHRKAVGALRSMKGRH
ncbi:uncharacterized protein ZBIST_1699 [Zygosaccharomyces bailii]|nr:uncharacterized protein ZBIST_1699 [Zygosaccharomyces bailii]